MYVVIETEFKNELEFLKITLTARRTQLVPLKRNQKASAFFEIFTKIQSYILISKYITKNCIIIYHIFPFSPIRHKNFKHFPF
jgi:hypothetical protein